MSTADLGGPSVHISRNPDARWIGTVIDDLHTWLSASPQLRSTNSLTGGGAIAAFEHELSARHGGRPALLTPSATYGLRLALEAVGAGAGTEVLVPATDWPASYAAVLSLGARPVPVDVDRETLTMSASAAAAARTERTVAAIVCHLHGVCADVPAIRGGLIDLPIIEDCAGALGSTLDGQRAGTLGDLSVFSFGPGKSISAGEGGAVLCSDPSLWERLVRASAHPLRLALEGFDQPADPGAFAVRPHPLTAVLGLVRLQRWDVVGLTDRHARRISDLRTLPGVRVLGDDARRTSAQPLVPVVVDADVASVGGCSGAQVLPRASTARTLQQVIAGLQLVPC